MVAQNILLNSGWGNWELGREGEGKGFQILQTHGHTEFLWES